MTRQEKEAAILAYCEEVTKGYDTPRGAGFVTIQRKFSESGKYHWFVIDWHHVNGALVSAMVEPGNLERLRNPDMLFLILGLETRALEDEVRRLKAGIWELSALVPYPNLALKYLNPPTP